MSGDPLVLVLKAFPGAVVVPRSSTYGHLVTRGDSVTVFADRALVDSAAELADSVGALLEHFGREEPGRLDRAGFVRVREALEALRENLPPPPIA